MRSAIGAVGGALAVGAMLVSYNLGERHALKQNMMPAMTPATQMLVGPDGIARPYLVQAGQPDMAQTAWTPYAAAPGFAAPYAYGYPAQQAYPVQTQYVQRTVQEPVVRRVRTQRVASEVQPRRSWQKSALLIGGSAGAGAGVGALVGGKKGALAGAAIGGGAAAIYDQIKRR